MVLASMTRLLGSSFLGFKIRKLHLSGETGTLFNRGASQALGSTQYPKGTSQNTPLKVFFKALTLNKRKKATLKSQRTEQAEPMTQPQQLCKAEHGDQSLGGRPSLPRQQQNLEHSS